MQVASSTWLPQSCAVIVVVVMKAVVFSGSRLAARELDRCLPLQLASRVVTPRARKCVCVWQGWGKGGSRGHGRGRVLCWKR